MEVIGNGNGPEGGVFLNVLVVTTLPEVACVSESESSQEMPLRVQMHQAPLGVEHRLYPARKHSWTNAGKVEN